MSSSFQYTKEDLLLDINNVSISFNNKLIIKNFSAKILNIKRIGYTQGQIVGLLGPSGIGKTTIFGAISGIRTPDEGTVTIGEERHPVNPGDVGVVAQNYPLSDHRTVMGNLIFSGKQSGLNSSLSRNIAKEYLSYFDLIEHATKYPIQLSGGQRQRVAIAQQLICSKHYIVMDEPFSGLDVVALTKCKKMIVDLASKDETNTFIIVTHDVTSAISICDTIWLMGRDRDIQGNIIAGAKIMEEIDLIERDIAWHDDPVNLPQSIQLIRDIKTRFLTL